jgi:toxin ParE1/3/4
LRIVGFERRITIAFTVSTENVTILGIFYGGRDWEKEL